MIAIKIIPERIKKQIDAAERAIANAQGELADAKKAKDSKRMEQAQKAIDKNQAELESAQGKLTQATEYYEVEYYALDTDPEGDVLQWSINTMADWLSIDTITGKLKLCFKILK